jgi:ribonuclease HI
VKLYMDGAAKGTTGAGCGDVLRGEHGEWLCGFSKYLGSCSVYISELWGVLLGLESAWTCGFKRVELQMDSKGKYPQFKKDRE